LAVRSAALVRNCIEPSMRPPLLPRLLVPRLPFFYGWVVLGCICLAGFARQGPAVAVLSVFVVPMTDAFGWSRTEMSGAVSLGGVLAAFIAPLLGPVLDRRGARLILCLAVLGTGFATMALSLTQSLLVFYLLFCFARMVWAGPFDLGLYGALNNWFVARRALATSIATLAQMSGLVALPIIAQLAMRGGDWRDGYEFEAFAKAGIRGRKEFEELFPGIGLPASLPEAHQLELRSSKLDGRNTGAGGTTAVTANSASQRPTTLPTRPA